MVTYSFQLENFEKWLARFAPKLGTTLDDRLLTMPAHLGEGIVLARNVNPHFSYAIMNFKLNSDLEMHRESGSKGFLVSFNQVEAQREPMSLPSQAVYDKRPLFRNDIFLTDAGDSDSVRLTSGATVKRLLIFCSHEMAAQYLPG